MKKFINPRRVLALLLALICCFSLVACSRNTATNANSSTGSNASQGSNASEDATSAGSNAGSNASQGSNSDDGDTEDATPYKFALYAPMTGDNAQYGLAYKTTLEIYINNLNANGGIDGHPVELEVFDDKNDPKEALNIANLIVSDPDIIAVVGSQTSSATLAAAPVFQEAGIPMMTPQGSHIDITLIGEYIFRMSCLSIHEGGFAAKCMVDDGYKNLAIIYANDDYGVSVSEYWAKVAEESGATVVASETFVSGQTKDFTPLLSKIKASGADAIFVEPGYSDAAMILTQMEQLDCDFQPYGTTMLYKDEFMDLVGDIGEGMYVANNIYPENTEENFVFISEAYKEATGNIVDLYVLNSYDCIALFCDAVKAVGTDGAAIAEWVANVKDWQGASGVINFDEDRNPAKDFYRFKIEGGEFVYVD